MTDKPRAVVREVNGQLVLDDPEGLAVARAVEKHNCRQLFDLNRERIAHFVHRVSELGRNPHDTVIVIINADDVHGGPLAEVLMPGQNWQDYRDRGELPIARGLAVREGIQDVLATFDAEAAHKLQAADGLCVVVVDRGVAEVYPEGEL